MSRIPQPLSRLLCALLALAGACAPAIGAAPDWRQKVHGSVLSAAEAGERVEFLVVLEERADLSAASTLQTKEARGRFTYDSLRDVATRTQAPLIQKLEARGVEHRAFWITNMLWVRGDLAILAEIAGHPEVATVAANPRVAVELPGGGVGTDGLPVPTEWNLVMVRADQVWDAGYTGRGIVIGGQDTGYEWTHPALLGQYRGWDGLVADHDYNWHDAIHTTAGSACGAESPEPCDDHNHGTHTMGIMVGDDADGNRVGMAPGARWIGCRNMDEGMGTPASYTECFQWLVAPTDVGGENPDPSRAPHVINNSWDCPEFEGCDPGSLQAIVESVRAAGIVVVTGAGNNGSACESVLNPPSIYDASISVGATDDTDTVAGFSGRGPVTVDGSGRIKPDISAPGVGIRSSIRDGEYAEFSGTSMAAPHVAGLVALLLEARPDLIGRVEEIETMVTSASLPRTTTEECGGTPGDAVPNNTYGHGRIDAFETLFGDADQDGIDNLGDCAPIDPGSWAPPGPVTDLILSRTDVISLTWTPPVAPGALTPLYDLLRTETPADLDTAECIESGLDEPLAVDSVSPTPFVSYIVRVRNVCGSTLGDATSGPRFAPACP